MSLVKVYVNSTPVRVFFNTSLIGAIALPGINIPRFCYHDRLNIAGNCRICLVEVEKSPKPQASCALPVTMGMKAFTSTPMVKKAREAVLELLLVNHPLDCPICDQGGCCDLQDQAIKFGSKLSRFYIKKRGVEDKSFGPLIKTIITRCIHCTRCLRFASLAAGVEDLGTSLRGGATEIGTYVNKVFHSEVSANIIDLCPVGALTSKVYAFKARPWETKLTKSIDISDSLGSPMSVETKNAKILRVLPRYNQHLKIEWCSDKARYVHEANDRHRLAIPYAVNKAGSFQKLTSTAFQKLVVKAFLIKSKHFDVVLGRHLDNLSLLNAKILGRRLGADILSEFPFRNSQSFAINYASFFKLHNLEKAKSIIFLGVNPRWETTNANLLIRFRFLSGNFASMCIGSPVNLTYFTENFGSTLGFLYKSCTGKHTKNQALETNAIVASGDSLNQRFDAMSIFALGGISQKSQNFLCLSNGGNSAAIGHLGLGLWKEFHTTYFVGPETPKSLKKLSKNNYICETAYVHNALKNAMALYPLQTYLEKNAHYTRYDGIVQKAHKVLNFGVPSLQNVSSLVDGLKTKGFFSSWKKASKNKYFLNIHTTQVFGAATKKWNTFKTINTPLKSFYGNSYNLCSFLISSPTLLQVSKLQRKEYWSFL